MAHSEKDYLSMGRQTRIDLALSIDVQRQADTHPQNKGLQELKSIAQSHADKK